MFFFATSIVSLSLFSIVSATIAPSSPVSSTTCRGGSKCKIAWVDDHEDPQVKDFGPVAVGLYVGNRLQQTLLQNFGTVDDASKTRTLNVEIDPESGPDGSDYFVRFQSTSAKDDQGYPLQSFSAKFELTNMNGTFSQAIQNQIAGVTSGVSAPQVLTATGGAAASVSNLAQTPAAPAATKNSSASDEDSAVGRIMASASAAIFGAAVALLF